MNELAHATSPYLLQHKDNPVEWREWSDAAFDEARRRDVPVLLSVGYAACHWCHVMAHESFEDPAIAALMNAAFVNIKVDREERPDIDAVYMEATLAMTGRGGWPMTCLLTPDAEPFFAGTYFPPPQFAALIDAATEAWTQRRADVLAAGQRIADALAESPEASARQGTLAGAAELGQAIDALYEDFDQRSGGYGGAPKFPPSMVLEFLLRHHARTGDARALQMVERTCEAMARGGIHDQLAGGFARYSVDADWVVPHFEKMLYDNAQLLRVYLHWHRAAQAARGGASATGSALALRVARETADFLIRDLGTLEGGFASALDADAGGHEGLTYVWTPAQLRAAMGDEGDEDGEADGAWAAQLLGVTEAGTFEDGASTLQLRADPVDDARWARVRAALLAARADRPQPMRDDKVVTAWNGLAIAGLAEAGALLNRPDYLDAARRCADLLLSVHLVDGRLRRSSRDGVAGRAEAVAEDYGDLAEGLLAMHQATGEARWLEAAGSLLDSAVERFSREDGGFHDTAHDAEPLLRRPWDPTDNVSPSGQTAIAGALLTYSALSGSSAHRARAERALGTAAWLGPRQPRFVGWACAVVEAVLAGPVQIAVAGDNADVERAARWTTSPGAVVVVGEPDAPGIPLLAMRPLVGGQAAAYVCQGFVCDAPVTTVEGLSQALERMRALGTR